MKFIKFILLTGAFAVLLFNGPSRAIGGDKNAGPEEFKLQQQKRSSEYLAGQDAETRTFMESLKGMGRDEKLLAVKDFKTKHYSENCEFREKMHAAQVDFVKARMELNPSLPQAMKDKKLALLEREYEEFKIFHAQKNKENMEFIDGLIADKSKDGQELDKLLQDFMKSQKSDAKQFLEKQNEKYRKSMQ
jgi:hypothetical protein